MLIAYCTFNSDFVSVTCLLLLLLGNCYCELTSLCCLALVVIVVCGVFCVLQVVTRLIHLLGQKILGNLQQARGPFSSKSFLSEFTIHFCGTTKSIIFFFCNFGKLVLSLSFFSFSFFL